MFPSVPMPNLPNYTVANTVFSSQCNWLLAIFKALSNLQHLLRVKLTGLYFIATKTSLPTTLLHISHIVGARTYIQMIRIAAWRIITFVTYKHSWGNYLADKYERQTMSRQCLIVKTIQTAITLIIHARFPWPTFVRTFHGHLLPKTFLHGSLWPSMFNHVHDLRFISMALRHN